MNPRIVDEEYEPGVPGRACLDCNCGWPATEPDGEWHHHERGCPSATRHRCPVNLAGREEDCGRHITYTPCNKPAPWTVSDRRGREFHACEKHANECLLDGCEIEQ